MRWLMRCLAAALVLGCAAGCDKPQIEASETTYNFGATERVWPLTLTFSNFVVSGFAIDYTIDCGAPWLSCVPNSGSVTDEDNTAAIRVTVDRNALPEEGGETALTVTAKNMAGSNSATLIAQARHPQPALGLSGTSYDFGTAEDRWTLDVWNAGDAGTSLVFAVTWQPESSWLACTPASGRSESSEDKQAIAVTVDRNLLPAGVNSGQVTISATGASLTPKTVPVTAKTGVPLIAVSRDSIVAGEDEFQWSVQVWNGGDEGTQLAFQVEFSPEDTWLNVTPTSGSSTGETDKRTLVVTADPDLLSIGPNSGEITITGDRVSPFTLPVYVEGASPEGEA